MDSSRAATFTGFTPQAPEFLHALATNNHREWFEEHRAEFVDFLQKPLQGLAAALAGPLMAIDSDLITEPRRVVSRIHRDTRFSRDKSPFKTTMWLTFKRPITAWQDAPAYFFEICADAYRFGMGFYSASTGTMDRLRREIEHRPARFRQAVAFLEQQDTFVVEGELYKRILRPDLADDLQGWHRRRNLYLVCNRQPDKALFSQGLVDDLCRGFLLLGPLYGYLSTLTVRGQQP